MQESRINVETPDKDTSTWGNDGRLWESMCRPAASSKAAEPQPGHRSVESIVAAARAAAGARVLPDAEWKDDRGVTHRRENGQESVTLEKVERWNPTVGDYVRFQAGYYSGVGQVVGFEDGYVRVSEAEGGIYRVLESCIRKATPDELASLEPGKSAFFPSLAIGDMVLYVGNDGHRAVGEIVALEQGAVCIATDKAPPNDVVRRLALTVRQASNDEIARLAPGAKSAPLPKNWFSKGERVQLISDGRVGTVQKTWYQGLAEVGEILWDDGTRSSHYQAHTIPWEEKAEPVAPARPAAPEWLVVGAKVSYKRGARKGATVGTVTAVFTSELNGVCEWYGAVLWPDGGSESMQWQGLVPADADVPVVDHIAFSWAVEGANIRDKRTREVGIVERVYTDADGEKHMDVVWPSADEGSDRSTERCFEGMQYEPVPASEGYSAGGQPPVKAPLTAEDAAAYLEDYAFLRGEFAALAEERSAVAATLEGAATRLAGIQQALDMLGPVLDELKAKVTGA